MTAWSTILLETREKAGAATKSEARSKEVASVRHTFPTDDRPRWTEARTQQTATPTQDQCAPCHVAASFGNTLDSRRHRCLRSIHGGAIPRSSSCYRKYRLGVTKILMGGTGPYFSALALVKGFSRPRRDRGYSVPTGRQEATRAVMAGAECPNPVLPTAAARGAGPRRRSRFLWSPPLVLIRLH